MVNVILEGAILQKYILNRPVYVRKIDI